MELVSYNMSEDKATIGFTGPCKYAKINVAK